MKWPRLSAEAAQADHPGALPALLLLFLLVPLLLMLARFLDTNTLVSWQWAMGTEQPARISLLLLLLLLIARRLSCAGQIFHSLPVLLAVAALLPIPFFSAPEPVIDAGRYFVQAKQLAHHGIPFFWREWGHAIPPWTDLPMVPFLHGLWLLLWGDCRLASQGLAALFFVALVAVTVLLGRELLGEKSGTRSGWLLLASPYLLFLSPAFLVDIPAAFFTVATLWCSLVFLKTGRSLAGITAAVCLVAGLLTKYSLWLIVPPLAAALLAGCMTRDNRQLLLARTMCVALPAAAVVSLFLFLKRDVVAMQWQLLATFQLAGLGRWDEGFWSTFLFQIHPLVLLLALSALFPALHRKNRSLVMPLTAVLLMVLAPTHRIRYLLPLLPLVCLAAAKGLELLPSAAARRFTALCAAAMAICVALAAYLPFARQTAMMNIVNAGKFLETMPGDMVRLAVYSPGRLVGPAALVPLVDMATEKKICLEPHAVPFPVDRMVSPLRFTWEMDLGDLYPPCGTENELLLRMVVTDGHESGPAHKDAARGVVFSMATEAFAYQPRVTVFP